MESSVEWNLVWSRVWVWSRVCSRDSAQHSIPHTRLHTRIHTFLNSIHTPAAGDHYHFAEDNFVGIPKCLELIYLFVRIHVPALAQHHFSVFCARNTHTISIWYLILRNLTGAHPGSTLMTNDCISTNFGISSAKESSGMRNEALQSFSIMSSLYIKMFWSLKIKRQGFVEKCILLKSLNSSWMSGKNGYL